VTAPREHGILFTAEMVRAILDSRKSQTRRIVSPRTSVIGSLPIREWHSLDFDAPNPRLRVDGQRDSQYLHVPHRDGETVHRVYPRIEPGHRLWVRETWAPADRMYQGHNLDSPGIVAYRADLSARRLAPMYEPGPVSEHDLSTWRWESFRWRPSIHMPRWASRITLEVTEVRVERLQDITEEDAQAEGMHGWEGCTWAARFALANLWDTLAPVGAQWNDAPWVWVVGFRRLA
jgi:hypothetical protein